MTAVARPLVAESRQRRSPRSSEPVTNFNLCQRDGLIKHGHEAGVGAPWARALPGYFHG